MDIHIFYTLLSAIVGGVMGARARLGEVSIYLSLLCCMSCLSWMVFLGFIPSYSLFTVVKIHFVLKFPVPMAC